MNSLMTEVIEDHIRLHVVEPAKDAERARGAEELIEAVRNPHLEVRPRHAARKGPAMAQMLPNAHSHVFLGEGHERNERRTRMVIALCSFMMVVEIVGVVLLFGSVALVADGLHMSTHAGALFGRARL